MHQSLFGFDEELRVACVNLGLRTKVTDVQVHSIEVEDIGTGQHDSGHIIEVGIEGKQNPPLPL